MRRKMVGLSICMLMVAAAFVPALAAQSTEEPCKECASSGNPIVKWEQLPDMTPNGVDVDMTRDANTHRILADDFRCNVTGYITKIHFWGSWFNDMKGIIKLIHLSIHEDIPANQSSTNYSMPGKMLWQANFTNFTEHLYSQDIPEWWYNPYTTEVIPNSDHMIWEYDVNISETNAFKQLGTATKPVVYWLDAYVETMTGLFGWKTAGKHWNDDAVYYTDYWKELKYPPQHPLVGQSIDLAFRITTTPIVCCFKVTFPLISLMKVKVKVTETCNRTQTNVPWNMTISWGTINKYYTGTIATLAALGSTTISSGTIIHFGWVTVTVKVDDCPPVVKRVLMLFGIIIAPP